MILLLGAVGIFFFYNYRLLSLLEREDWPALAYFLEQKIYVKRQYNARYVQLLASSYLVISDYASVLKLEGKAMLVKPSVVAKNVLLFGAARVLSGNHADAVTFFKTHLGKGNFKGKNEQWGRWFYGFSQLLAGDSKMTDFASLAVSSNDAIITALSAYFLNNSISKKCENPAECLAIAERGRERVVNIIKNTENWKREVDRMSGEIHVAIIRKYIDEAGNWLFKS
jgi:hypothetical protein